MAQIDMKETELRIFDGTLGTLSSDSAASDADLDWTAVSTHMGTDKVSITLVDPAVATQPLSIVVTGREIVIDLETDAGPVVISTAAEVVTAIEADADASALVTVIAEGDGSGLVDAIVLATLDGQKSITIKVGEGNLSHSEKRPVEFTRDRGIIDTVRLADQEPMDLSFDLLWEFITAVASSGTPTPGDALKKIGEASAWITTADDPCQPYCVDIELHHAPDCTGVEDEITTFEEFYYETLDSDLREGTIAASGRCNRIVATNRRVLAAVL